jgi:hypothetical protein
MTHDSTACLDDPRELRDLAFCMHPVSKDVRGELVLLDSDLQRCAEEECRTLKTDHLLTLENVVAHEPCDGELSRLLDGRLVVRSLITAFADGSGERRGLHTGVFDWSGSGGRVRGTLSGTTNAGTHRQPAFDPCQECEAPGFIEGRLCGQVLRAANERLRGCSVAASYRLRFDANEQAVGSGVTGIIEGLIVCPCAAECLDLTGFAAMAHPNPWIVGTMTFLVHDFNGTPTATADIVTIGAFTGLNAGFETRIALASPVDAVDIALVHFSAPASAVALDGSGTVIDTQTMTAAGGTAQTLHLGGGGIEALTVQAPNDETLILEICTS